MALTNSPVLEAGVMLSVMAMPQRHGFEPRRIEAGERIEIRFGYCCPQIEEATIVASANDRIEMAVGDTIWKLRPGSGRVDVPGILSDDWVVAESKIAKDGHPSRPRVQWQQQPLPYPPIEVGNADAAP